MCLCVCSAVAIDGDFCVNTYVHWKSLSSLYTYVACLEFVWQLALPGLHCRNLGRNRLAFLRPDMFTGIPALRSLFLYYNNLTYIPQNVFSGMPAIGRV